jgi:hypothetical protein
MFARENLEAKEKCKGSVFFFFFFAVIGFKNGLQAC